MKIGTMFLGKVEALGGESIQTKFFVLGVPLIPLNSYYFFRETVGGGEGVAVPLNGRSVLAGYLRIVTFTAALLFGIFTWIEARPYRFPTTLCVLACVSVVLGLLALRMGRVRPDDAATRMLLRPVTGTCAHPRLVSDLLARETYEVLLREWKKRHVGQSWQAHVRAGKPESALLAHALAVYAEALAEPDASPQLIARARHQCSVARPMHS